jgi:hypothetical protein
MNDPNNQGLNVSVWVQPPERVSPGTERFIFGRRCGIRPSPPRRKSGGSLLGTGSEDAECSGSRVWRAAAQLRRVERQGEPFLRGTLSALVSNPRFSWGLGLPGRQKSLWPR